MINEALKKLSTIVVNPDIGWDNEWTPKVQSTVKPDREYSFNEISENLNNQFKPTNAKIKQPKQKPRNMIIKHYGKMTWNEAIDTAFDNGEYIPNYEQAKALNLYGSWTSTTFELTSTQAKVLGLLFERASKTNELPVVTINESNYTPDTIAYRTGDEGDGSTNN